MELQSDSERCHISHYMHLVSAYVDSPEMIKQLIDEIKAAQIVAKETGNEVIVSQDSIEFFFLVYPSGRIGLCALMKMFNVVS